MEKKVRNFDLSNAEEAKLFLAGLRIQDQKVTGVQSSNGKWIEFKDLDDKDSIKYASMVYRDLMEGKPNTLLSWDDEAIN